ncbi:hypothetical protein LTV02_01655 [Nocardia yamanashiensis]|uniref:hypothetical protein n=1 Tax=Nocardia yamanashiensis TaxID=209247 RepID=UPI001E61E6CB|nr:hypothetical protein [Nocardia yamanashiensis]UGT42162.1 hypothetical protein LTV02_01655 [Nocardia yamanashiensis]
MSDDQLTLNERCVLFILMAEARELTNVELYTIAGLRLDGRNRRRLNDLELVTSILVRRAYVHELTDRGALWCRAELAAERPPRSGSAGGALYSVLAGLGRHLDDTGHTLAEIFRPDVAGQVEAAYAELTRGRGTALRLTDLRDRLSEMPRAEVDHALKELARRENVHIRAESDQKTLTDRDREAALVLGGTPRHLLMIEVSR